MRLGAGRRRPALSEGPRLGAAGGRTGQWRPLTRLIARVLGRPAAAVRIAAGEGARVERVEIDGVDRQMAVTVFGAEP
jgi:uncharacterized protein YggU (UPF0235/DUF167 family)